MEQNGNNTPIDPLQEVRDVLEHSYDEYWEEIHAQGSEVLAKLERLKADVIQGESVANKTQQFREDFVALHERNLDAAQEMLAKVCDHIETLQRSQKPKKRKKTAEI